MKSNKIFILILSLFMIFGLLSLTSCKSDEEKEDNFISTFVYSNYENVETITDIDEYYAATQGERQYLADDNGIIISPYHTLKVNDIDVPVYSTRVEHGLHSFCYLLVNEDRVKLNVEIKTFQDMECAVVLPISSNVTATTTGNITKATLNDFGSFSLGFNDTNTWGLTIMVAKYEEFTCPNGYTVVEYEPGDYSGGANSDGLHTKREGSFDCTEEKTAYYFKKGHYLIHDIKVGSNVEIYFEPGTYIEDYIYYEANGESLDVSTFMTSTSTKNVLIYGNALIDFASHIGGGPTPIYKKQFDFGSVSNFEFKGIISIDSCSWTLCFTDSKNVEVDWNLFLSYKQCSDGIMLSDCQDSTVHHNFCRVGDDAIEAKSTGSIGSNNLIYEYNAVWADKARCYGCIYEANNDMSNITFRYNSVGYSNPHWANYGCLVIAMGNNKNATWQDIHFEDTEIYYTTNKILAMYCQNTSNNGGGNIKNIYFKNITCYASPDVRGELVYIDICEDSTIGKCYIENFMYKDANGNMVQYTKEDKKDETLTHVNVSHLYSLGNINVK